MRNAAKNAWDALWPGREGKIKALTAETEGALRKAVAGAQAEWIAAYVALMQDTVKKDAELAKRKMPDPKAAVADILANGDNDFEIVTEDDKPDTKKKGTAR